MPTAANFYEILQAKAKLGEHLMRKCWSKRNQQLSFKYFVKIILNPKVIIKSIIDPDNLWRKSFSSNGLRVTLENTAWTFNIFDNNIEKKSDFPLKNFPKYAFSWKILSQLSGYFWPLWALMRIWFFITFSAILQLIHD